MSTRFTAALLLVAAVACGGKTDTGNTPAAIETEHGGKGLTAFMKGYWAWNAAGQAPGGHDGDILFMPLPNGTDPDGDGVFSGSIDVTLAKSQGFVFPILGWVGETYQGGNPPDDDPTGPPTDDAFTTATAKVTLDGTVILDSTKDDLKKYYVPATRFDATVPYVPVQDRGNGAFAAGAIWAKSVGFLHEPLAAGSHKLHLDVKSEALGVGYSNDFNLTAQ